MSVLDPSLGALPVLGRRPFRDLRGSQEDGSVGRGDPLPTPSSPPGVRGRSLGGP